MIFIEVKSLAGMNYIRASDILAVQYSDPQHCLVILTSGTPISCAEAAKDLVARIETSAAETAAQPKDKR